MADPIMITGFAGINNKSPAHRIQGPTKQNTIVDLVTGENFDLDNSGRAVLRDGYDNIMALTGCHSGYSFGGVFLLVKSGTLCRFYPETLAITPLVNVGNDNKMRYWPAAGRIFFTNGTVIGEVKDGTATLFPETTTAFKAKMKVGQAIAHYRGRLYVAQGKVMWTSDVKPLYRTDLRHGFKQFPDNVRVIAPTTDGLYVGTEKACYFLGGLNPLKMSQVKISDGPVKDLPVVYIAADKIKGLNIEGSFPLIMTDDGLNIGLPQGNLLNLTQERHLPPDGISGTAILKQDTLGQFHYITAYR
jgi:hypothetical protein